MEPWTDGEPLIFTSELSITRELRGWSLGLGLIGRRCFLTQNFFCLRTPRMEPWTDGAPLILKSELPLTRELLGWSLGLMGRP